MKQNRSKRYICLIILVFVGISAYEMSKMKLLIEESQGIYLVDCIDGDTAKFMIDGNEQIVRFLAIDTPETVKKNTPVQPFGKEASDMTCGLLTNATRIELEFEDSNKQDKYDRLLAWVWVDGELLQQKLVAEGYAEVKYLYDDYKYNELLLGVQDYTKEQKKGIWGN